MMVYALAAPDTTEIGPLILQDPAQSVFMNAWNAITLLFVQFVLTKTLIPLQTVAHVKMDFGQLAIQV